MLKRTCFGIKLLNILLLSLMMGCGFHLRGVFHIPKILKMIQIRPNQPFDPFQRVLRQTLKNNQIQVLSENSPNIQEASILTILNQGFSERVLAYGTDGQATRAIIQFTMTYQLTEANGKLIVANNTVQVERELAINSNAVLSTDNERARIRSDLLLDGASQLIRQLSMTPTPSVA